MNLNEWLVSGSSIQLRDIREYVRGSSDKWASVDSLEAGLELLRADTSIASRLGMLEQQLRLATVDKAAADKAAADKAAADQVAADQVAADQVAVDKAAADKAAADKGAAAMPLSQSGNPSVLSSGQPRWVSAIIAVGSTIGVAVVVLLAIGMFALVLVPARYGGILPQLKDIEIARGLITFVFAFGVMFIAMLLLIALFSSGSPDISERFDKAKELFTALIAVLGTIMGFYFGAAESQRSVENQDATSIGARIGLLGITAPAVGLPPDKFAQIELILTGSLGNEDKKIAIQNIIVPPTEDSVIAAMARLEIPVKDVKLNPVQIGKIDEVLDRGGSPSLEVEKIKQIMALSEQ